ncbi:antiviral reverse transcriptase Drt3b [Porphyromonas gingivalis]|uniref:antiviral reverse transcriptase Drt3b n=1 Tax=Porphyromonas gingivalis TaxID=837 RepID=UPI001E4E0893|nr:antiviral reverse transcriptase Drt3b [Porphyromonas gingivalis]MDP0531456.1 RNA-directed DNA polymerase [Porphyromonas gingivalis]MDP0625095.1 RNA-directed DNA polymerase [Porphyromonas gingivalis]WKD53045.1 RNA-directed DNA polymerase [Porphyromonas gingivalis]WKD55094.1 RNA-directed DNA polymerase [Porphyromonas gingivalis]
MRKRKKIKLSYSKERVLFSDVLPYECPIIFSNRYLYRFLAKYLWVAKEQKVDNITWNILKQSKRLDEKDANAFAALLFGCYEKGKRIGTLQHRLNDLFYPYQFNIAHKPNKNRTLSIIHPYSQWQVVEFYNQYKYSILYLCNQSKYSLRKPHKIAQCFYYRDRLHRKLLGHESDKVELFFNEYENLKTYFSYEKYSNIYKFYEDYRYQRAEKKFKHLVKFDLQSCFDSIYTHTISWATAGGADKVKVLPGYHGSWVGDTFDNLMQSVNARETNGIVIGPEFSRIFAEIILQYIDQKVEQELLDGNLRQKSNYECYRYVDDYFLFYNDEKDRNIFMESLTKWLKEFKLQISPSKTEEFERPFITKVTIAKQRIEHLFSDIFSTPLWEEIESNLDVEKEDETEYEDSDKDREILDKKFNIYLPANSVNTRIKAIVRECEIEYRDIANYLLEKMSQRLDAFLNRYEMGFKKYERLMSKGDTNKDGVELLARRVQRKLTSYLVSLIDVAFFVFNSNRQVNTTLKLQKIMNTIVIYAKRHGDFKSNPEIRFQTTSKDIIFKKIQDEIALVLATTDSHRNTLHESLYLLILSKELGSAYLFAPEVIKSFIKKSELQYNLFACIILMYYYANHKCYNKRKTLLKDEILKKYRLVAQSERKRNSELTILTADMMTCPFVEDAYKQKLLTLMGITETEDQQMIMRFAKKQKYIFTRWTMFNLNKELQAKISQEVYS